MKKKEDKEQLLEQTVSARQETREGLVLLSWAQQGPEPRQGQNGHGAQWEGQKSPRQAGKQREPRSPRQVPPTWCCASCKWARAPSGPALP